MAVHIKEKCTQCLLKTQPYYVADGVVVLEEFFLVSPYWFSVTFNAACEKNDFELRGITGFIRSSPCYNHDPVNIMFPSYHPYLNKIPTDCVKLNQIINAEMVNDVTQTHGYYIPDYFFIWRDIT